MLSVFRDFLENVATAWEKVTNEQKNRLARHMFDVVWTSNNKVVAVRPRAELGPFFQVSEHCQEKSLSGDPDRIQGVRQDFANAWYPVYAPYQVYASHPSPINSKLPPVLHGELIEKRKTHSLRRLAREYGVSHETIRNALHKEGVSS